MRTPIILISALWLVAVLGVMGWCLFQADEVMIDNSSPINCPFD